MMVVLGLTGGVASGKSTVSRMLKQYGAAVIDADELARDAVAPGTDALAEIARHFGPGVIRNDGSLDRRALGAIVFADPLQRQRLERIVHPHVYAAMFGELKELRSEGSTQVAVLDVPLLFETQVALPLCDKTVVVWVPQPIQLARLMQRSGLDQAAALRRIRAQMPLEQKRRLAHFIIDNSGSPEATAAQVEALWADLTRAV